MVVGAFTIINTIGLLGGLPLTINTANNEITKDINNNFSYCFSSSNTFDNTYRIILDFQENVSSLPTEEMALNVYYNSSRYIFYFETYVNNNYIVFSYDSVISSTSANLPHFTIDFTAVSLGANSYTLNNVYIAKQTSSLTPISGTSITDAITSGLGLMGDITTNFKNGFSSLIWNSEKNSLTTFGNFALIFLGVSITFAIVKLCLNLIRSKTGV